MQRRFSICNRPATGARMQASRVKHQLDYEQRRDGKAAVKAAKAEAKRLAAALAKLEAEVAAANAAAAELEAELAAEVRVCCQQANKVGQNAVM